MDSYQLKSRHGIFPKTIPKMEPAADADYATIDAGMSKYSNYEHDKAMEGGIAIPEPDELLADIWRLDAWRGETYARGDATAEMRK